MVAKFAHAVTIALRLYYRTCTGKDMYRYMGGRGGDEVLGGNVRDRKLGCL